MRQGKYSQTFDHTVYITETASVAGKKEGEGPLGTLFDYVEEDPQFGQDNWEAAESQMQKQAAETAIQKAGISREHIQYLLGGDLLGQNIATSFGVMDLDVPVFGLYGACSTMGESMVLGSMLMDGGAGDYILCVTSSHFATAEKQFRFPLEYGNQRPQSATWTVTGAGAVLLGNQHGTVRISGVTPGKIVDFGVRDSMNMGAAMAPAAADTIIQNLEDFGIGPDYYDKIITGDLGYVGQTALTDLLKKRGYDIAGLHTDCGIEIFNKEKQDTHSGGSGCGCAAITLASYIMKNLERGEWKRVLFVPTGALLSTVSFNEGNTIPGIAHGVMLERV